MPETFKNVYLPCYCIALTEHGITSALTLDCETVEERSMMDAIESMILAHHCAGIDVSDPAYVAGIVTAVEACWNNL